MIQRQPHKAQPLAQIHHFLPLLHHHALTHPSGHQHHAVVGCQQLVDVGLVNGPHTKPPPEMPRCRHIKGLQFHSFPHSSTHSCICTLSQPSILSFIDASMNMCLLLGSGRYNPEQRPASDHALAASITRITAAKTTAAEHRASCPARFALHLSTMTDLSQRHQQSLPAYIIHHSTCS